MAGTKIGGQKARETNRVKYGPDFYARIGKMGGLLGKTGGFASQLKGTDGLTGHQRAAVAGKIGGRVSTRSKNKLPLETRRELAMHEMVTHEILEEVLNG